METNKMKELAKKFGTILIMKGEEPDVIIMDYKKYVEMENNKTSAPTTNSTITTSTSLESTPTSVDPKQAEEEATLIDNLNKEIQSLNQEIEAQTQSNKESNHTHESVEV